MLLIAALSLAPLLQQQDEVDLTVRGDAGGRPGSGSVTYQLGFYDRGDGQGDGNPFLDESLTVIEPLVLFTYNVSEDTTYFGKLSYDWVSSASIERLSAFPAQSGASGDFYVGAEVGARTKTNERWTLGGRLGASFEYDYFSAHLGGDAAWQRIDQDASVTMSLNAYFDTIDVIRFNGDSEGTDNRTTFSGTVNWYQVLGPRTTSDVGLTLSSQSGFLETAYNAVVLEDPGLAPNPNLFNNARGVEVSEAVPNDRLRTAVYGGVKQSLGPGRAVELRGRVYSDDWGIAAYDVEPRYYQALGDKHLLRFRYRYYTQSEADFYQDTFLQADGTPVDRTQDADLGDFTAQSFGVKWIYTPRETSRWGVGVDYVDRDDGLDNIYGFMSWTWSF
ncbi:MAG: DUF3570 domain-containing protein [Planctomycetota bacterium]